MFFLRKLVTQFIYPLNVAILAALLAMLLYHRKHNRVATALLAAAIVWLWLWSMPAFSGRISGWLEQSYPPRPIEQLEPADAIVVLGGGVEASSPPRLYPEVNAAGDRVVHAARLYKAGKAKVIIASGGHGFLMPDAMGTEAEAIQSLLEDLGVPKSAILLEDESRNTEENALCSKRIAEEHGFKKLLLVTSALHMRRALAEFRTVWPETYPAPTDFEIIDNPDTTLFDYLPDTRTLEAGSRAFKEIAGLCVHALLP